MQWNESATFVKSISKRRTCASVTSAIGGTVGGAFPCMRVIYATNLDAVRITPYTTACPL